MLSLLKKPTREVAISEPDVQAVLAYLVRSVGTDPTALTVLQTR